MSIFLRAAILIGLLRAAPQEQKAPVPDAATLKDAEKLVKDVFREEYAKRGIADRIALAKKLLEQGVATRELPSQFVLFREARDIAAQSSDLETSLRAIAHLEKRFEVNSAEMKLAVFSTAAKAARTPEELCSLARSCLRSADSAIAAGDYETADKAAEQGAALAKRSKDAALTARADAKRREVSDLKGRAARVKKAREALGTAPDDPAANQIVGQFECLTKGNWAAGLPHLAKAPEGTLRAAAIKDLGNSTDPAEQVRVGDAWWDLSEKETGGPREQLRRRATHWYDSALPQLTGLERIRVENRAKTFRLQRVFRGTWVDFTDPAAFREKGKPGDPITLTAPKNGTVGTFDAEMPKGTFDGVSVRVRLNENPAVFALLAYQTHEYGVHVDMSKPAFESCYLDKARSKWETDQTTPCPPKNEYVMTVLIESGEHVLYLDGEPLLRREAPGLITRLRLLASGGTVTFDQIRLRKRE